ncbi:3'-5' exonuclease [Sulfurivirga sp.]|uniref:3'-5' exonuclease n=1 Tax=Sulfurivirga sp. TaxID=2614236 RepID=UPI0025F41AA1|nr:3'-5' exonuclease [Sulfurivirga sp.]
MAAHIMIDIETLGTRPDAAIGALAAVHFDPATGEALDTFEARINVAESLIEGFSADAATLAFWRRQLRDARTQVTTGRAHPREALEGLCRWLDGIARPDERIVWANGAGFDPVIVETHLNHFGLDAPWRWWNVRDLRTLRALAREAGLSLPVRPAELPEHQALADAIWQSRQTAWLLSALRMEQAA